MTTHHSDYIIVRIKSDRISDFRRVRRALHTLSEETGIDLIDVGITEQGSRLIRQRDALQLHGEVRNLFRRACWLLSRPHKFPPE